MDVRKNVPVFIPGGAGAGRDREGGLLKAMLEDAVISEAPPTYAGSGTPRMVQALAGGLSGWTMPGASPQVLARGSAWPLGI